MQPSKLPRPTIKAPTFPFGRMQTFFLSNTQSLLQPRTTSPPLPQPQPQSQLSHTILPYLWSSTKRERAAFCKPRGEKWKEAVRVASCNFSVLSEKVKREGEREREAVHEFHSSLHPQPAAITPNRNTTAAPPQPRPPHPVCERAERERKLQFCRVSELHCEVISGLRYVDQG